MKNINLFLLTVVLFCSLQISAFAATSYTTTDVAAHNTATDCWMVINNNVYNLTNYLSKHDSMLDIRPWCGKDATEGYNTKDGRGQNHSQRADTELAQFFIGTVAVSGSSSSSDSVSGGNVQPQKRGHDFNVTLPLFGTIVIYFLNLKLVSRQIHNFIWNSIMLLGLIPSFGYGVIMAIGEKMMWLRNLIGSNILYDHVEYSIIFGTACVLHFLFRVNIYLAQGKLLKGK